MDNEKRKSPAMVAYNERHSKAKTDGITEQRRCLVGELFKRGNSYRDIRVKVMAELALPTYSLSSVKKDVDAILAEWRENRIDNTDLALQLELERIETMVNEAWSGWEKSKEDYQKDRAKQEGVPTQGGDGNGVAIIKASKETEKVRSCGDPRYLETINRMLQEKRKLLGLYAPDKKVVQADLSFADLLRKTGKK